MTHNYYESVASGGAYSGSKQMRIFLYPQTASEISDCQSGGNVVEAHVDIGNQLVNFGAIDYYEVLRFRVQDYNYPGVYAGDYGIEDDFRNWLKNENGTGENLYSLIGGHELIHQNTNACDEDSGGYAPAGAGAEYTDISAFNEGVVAWAPADCNKGLTKNAAIQEILHSFIDPDADDPWTGSTDSRSDDQHTLGKSENYETTPMMTYHWDDNPSGSSCTGDNTSVYFHTQNLTLCTKKAVRDTDDYNYV